MNLPEIGETLTGNTEGHGGELDILNILNVNSEPSLFCRDS